MDLGQSKNASNNVLVREKEQRDSGNNQSSEQNILPENVKNSIVIHKNEESESSSASHGVSSSIIKEHTTATSNTIKVASIPNSENCADDQNLNKKKEDIHKSYDFSNNNEYGEDNDNGFEEENICKLNEWEPKDIFEDSTGFYSFKENDSKPEIHLDVNAKGSDEKERDDNKLNAEVNGQNNQNIDENLKKEQEQIQEQNKDKKKEVTVPWGLGATLGLEFVAPALLGGVLGPAAILIAILWLSHKSFKLPVTEKAKQFKEKHHKKRKSNKTNNEHTEKEVNMSTMSEEEQNEFMEVINENKEAFNKTLLDLFIENKETFEKAFEDMKEIDGIEEIPNYNELVETINDLDKIINNSSISKEEKEEKIQEFIDIGDIFFGHLEKNEEIMNKLNEKCNEKEEPVKTNSLFSAFRIVKNAKKIDDDVRKHGVHTSISQNGQGAFISSKND